jgi:hypothetical protein
MSSPRSRLFSLAGLSGNMPVPELTRPDAAPRNLAAMLIATTQPISRAQVLHRVWPPRQRCNGGDSVAPARDLCDAVNVLVDQRNIISRFEVNAQAGDAC